MDSRKQTSVDVTRESVELGGILNAMGQCFFDWRPDKVGSPAYQVEKRLRNFYDDGHIRTEHLPMFYKKLLREFPPSLGRDGPYDCLLRVIRDLSAESTIDFAVELFEHRVERGVEDDQVVQLLASMKDNPRAVSTLVGLLVEHRLLHSNDTITQLATVADNGPLCFPALASLIDVPEHSDTIIGIAATFHRAGTLPAETLEYVAAGIEGREMELVQRYLEAAEDYRDTDAIVDEQADLIDLAETFLDVPEVEEILNYVALYGGSRLALPALIVLLDNSRDVPVERLEEIAQQATCRREFRLFLAGIGRAALFPSSMSTVVHWAETELAERLVQHDCPVPPNDLRYIGSVEWETAPPQLKGHYLLFEVTGAMSDFLRRDTGNLERRFLAASGPHPEEPDETIHVDPWIPLTGTFVNLEEPIEDGDYEAAWEQWKARHPRCR